jgi:hypothetical protein
MTYVRLAQPTTCERCGRDLPRRTEAWRAVDGIAATCLHCLASSPASQPSPAAAEPSPEPLDVVDLTTPSAPAEPVGDDDLVLPDPGGPAARAGDRRHRALTEADLAPIDDAARSISAAARPRRRRRST